jgi:hypothetical protein
LAVSSKELGLNPAFLLDIDLRYSYIQPNQKRGFIVIIARHGSCRRAILTCSTALQTDLP